MQADAVRFALDYIKIYKILLLRTDPQERETRVGVSEATDFNTKDDRKERPDSISYPNCVS